MPSLFLVAALAAIERGYAVFPLRDKQPLTKWGGASPAAPGAVAHEPAEARRLDACFPRATGAGIKLDAAMGVFDCDTPAALWWCQHNLPSTYEVRTGRLLGGAHFYVSLPWRLRHNPRMLVAGLEFKTLGGYVVAPGSVHESGSTYTVHADLPVVEIPCALAAQIGPPRRGVDEDATPEELATWAAVAERIEHGSPAVAFASRMAADAIADADRWLRRELPQSDEWGRKFFGAAARIGVWVGQGLADYGAMHDMLVGIFEELDDGRGGAKGAAHVKRSIRRGLAAGARG